MAHFSIRATTLLIGGQHVHLLEAGQQGMPVVLLIHGGLGDANLHWHTTITALADSFHVYAPDLPGFHSESDPLPVPSLPHVMQWIDNLLQALHVERVLLVGTSVGGLIARFYAARHFSTVQRLILVDGGQIPTLLAPIRALINAPGISSAFYSLLYRQTYGRTSLQRSIYQHDLLTEDFLQRLERASNGYMPLIRSVLREPWPRERTPHCPTLVIWGKQDRLASPQEGEKLRREIPDVQLVLIDQSGHMPMLEQSTAFMTVVTAFLNT